MSIIVLTEGEHELRTIHRHPMAFLGDIISIIIFIAIPIILAIILIIIPKEFTDNFFQGDTNIGILFICTTWLLVAWMYAWWKWTDHFLDVIIITNKRIFEVKQNGFFNREITSFSFDKIQNIKVSQIGLLASIFQYGDLLIETASETENLHLTIIPNPEVIKKQIDSLQDHDKIKYA